MKKLLLIALFLSVPSLASAVPSGWTCYESYYNDGWCDCGCGAYDIDCNDSSNSLWQNCSGDDSCSWGDSTCYNHGIRVYKRGAFGGTTLEHTYPCRVDSSTRIASYCELDNVWGECYSEDDYCPDSWIGDSWCDAGCMNAYGDGGDGGDCYYSSYGHYCNGAASSGVDSNDVGGNHLGNKFYAYDTWFSNTQHLDQASLENVIDNVFDEVGDCEIIYGIDGTCHQHANRGFWFADEDLEVADFDVAGSTLSSIYGDLGGGFGDCSTQENID
ncbi:MAG: hypothetical protein PF689_05115 [Deltaproteobacteria bacterium]|jgi:hypothetical protein|nr:hypothetical protein [Deltaproteobacteria bacterium]